MNKHGQGGSPGSGLNSVVEYFLKQRSYLRFKLNNHWFAASQLQQIRGADVHTRYTFRQKADIVEKAHSLEGQEVEIHNMELLCSR